MLLPKNRTRENICGLIFNQRCQVVRCTSYLKFVLILPKLNQMKLLLKTKITRNFFRCMPRWAIISFRPSVSVFYTRTVPFKRIIVSVQAFNKSPWPSVLIQKKDVPDDKITLCYFEYENKNRQVFDPKKLKKKASQAFIDLREQEATTEYKHGKVKNHNAVLQAGRNGNATQVVKTPENLLKKLNEVFRFDFDPCPVFP